MTGTLRADGAHVVGEGYVLLNNTWGRRDLANGADYVQTIDYGDGLDGVLFRWSWPVVAPRRVLAYPEVIVGESPWSGLSAPGALPARLAEIESLTVTFDLDWGGETGLFNVAFDLWLSEDPEGGRHAITHEVMVWLKSAEFSPGGRPAATVSTGGLITEFRWKAADPGGWPQWSYAAFRSVEEVSEGRIDLAALLDHLIDEGLASPDLWLMDVELGAEIVGGAGWLRIDGFEVEVNPSLTGAGTESLELAPAPIGDAPH